jgi:putative phosphoesterase
MKLGLISDIHGNIHALDQVLNLLDREHVDAILCAGDLVCYGADHERVLSTLFERHIPCVAGNYDYAVAWNLGRASRKPSSPMNEPLKQSALDWTKSNISASSTSFLRNLPISASFRFDASTISMVHATIDQLDYEVLPEHTARLIELATRLQSKVIILGHTHKQFSIRVQNTLFINPGTVGRSLDRDLRACYAIFDTRSQQVDFHRVEYDIQAAIQSIRANEMPAGIAALVENGVARIDEVSPA